MSHVEAPVPFAQHLPRLQVRRAARAVVELARDPDDLPQVFTILDALSGTTLQRLMRRFLRTPSGVKLLAERADIVPLLRDREALRRLPGGTLGRAYLAFVESEGISAEGLVEASEQGRSVPRRAASYEYLHRRMRDTHDLWHAATGYKGDVLGEAALLAFSLAQLWNPGVALIVAVALVKGAGQGDANAVVLDGYRRGRAAAWLPAQEWEALLALPLDEVRRRLGLGQPPRYTPVRTAELRAAKII